MSSVLDKVALPIEEGINNEPRCPVVINLDISNSMSGDKIEAANNGLQLFAQELKTDPLARLRVEPLVIPFGSEVGQDRTWVTADDFQPQRYQASGRTALASAMIAGLDAIEDRKRHYYDLALDTFRPWLFLISDGAPTDPELLPQAIKRVEEAEAMKKATVFAVGVEGADMELLQRLSPSRQALQLRGLHFAELFIWLSRSLRRHSTAPTGTQVPLPPVTGWALTP